MKKLLTLVVIFLMTMSVFGQETKTDKAIRFYPSYIFVAGVRAHNGPGLVVSLPGELGKFRLMFFAKSLAWGTYQERGLGLEYSKLLNQPTSNPRYRITGGFIYSAENLYGDEKLPEKMATVYCGVSLVYDIASFITVETVLAPAITTLVSLPSDYWFRTDGTKFGLTGRIGLRFKM